VTAESHHIRVVKRARYYTIGPTSGAADIWLVCHGYGQLAARFINGFEAIAAQNRLIVAPEGLHRFYHDPVSTPARERRVGATWMTREDRDADIADYIDYLDQLTSELLAHAPGSRFRALGFSQGSATMLRWAVGATRVPEQLIIWGGEVPTDVDWNMGARKLAAARIDVVRGARDEMLPGNTLDRNLGTLTEAGLRYQLHSFDGAHHLDSEMLQRLAGS
jgi:predicted esterase